MATANCITFEEGWDNEIKRKAIVVLEDMLDNGMPPNKKQLFDNKEFVDVYTTCYNMCTQRAPYNFSKELYERHGATIEEYLVNAVLPAVQEKIKAYESSGVSGSSILLSEVQHRWNNHLIMNRWLSKFFNYLDRYHVHHHGHPTLSDSGLKIFKAQVYDVVKGSTTEAILAMINQEREDEFVDKTLLKSVVKLYESMGMMTLDAYSGDLEMPLLNATREYYANKREEWILVDSTPEYLIKTEKALTEEKTRVADYLNLASEPRILRVLEEELLEKVESTLLERENSGCKVLLANDKSEDLRRMFSLFGLLEHGLNPMAAIVQEYITERGMEIVGRRKARLDALTGKEKNDDPDFVKGLRDLHDKYLGVVKKDFSGHALFQKALKDAFVEVVNKNVGAYTNAELLSTFCDRILKAGGEKLSDQEVEDNLEKVVQLFSYLTDKDFFAEIYRQQLAKRLLDQRSASDDVEKLMIAKLKMQCGTQFTSKMEGMLGDLAVGGDQRTEFDNAMRQDANNSKLDFSVQVLTTGFWPSYKAIDVTLPDEMSNSMKLFKEWHDNKHAKRKLTWMHSLGSATVRAVFGKKQYDIAVTTLQAVALNLFNDGETYSFSDVAQKLNLDDNVVKPLMHSLSCGKFRVLAKTPASSVIKPTDSFCANQKFSSNMRKIRIQMPSLDTAHSNKKVEEDRSVNIDAAIVRIMKARKTLEHQQLIAEVLSQLAFFKPNPRVIKRRIEDLLDREYLERSADDAKVYNYLA